MAATVAASVAASAAHTIANMWFIIRIGNVYKAKISYADIVCFKIDDGVCDDVQTQKKYNTYV